MRTDLPPEAFTKETLQQAFEWLQTQPEPVRASIQTPENLVSLYRKSQRLDQNSDAPVSSKKFIDDLKNLATSLNEFSAPSSAQSQPQTLAPEPTAAPVTTTFIPEPQVEVKPQTVPHNFFSAPTAEPPQTVPPQSTFSKNTLTATERTLKSTTVTETTQKSIALNPIESLDPLSQERIQEVQKRFNIESPTDALRLLISIGYEKFSQFP